ncbi:MAG: hypothetical protein ACR2MN_03440 [Acidimicrobiales bacterium]
MDESLPTPPSANGHRPPSGNGHRPPQPMFIPVAEQIDNVRRWNGYLDWGFDEEDFVTVDLTPRAHAGPLVVDVVVPYLRGLTLGADVETLNEVRHTCHELWLLAKRQHPNSWCWDRSLWLNLPKPVRLLDGIVHRPGIRRVTVDLGAHWQPGLHIRPGLVRDQDSAHAEVLAAAAHFPRWIRAMGRNVPHTWISGYQVTVPHYAVDKRLPVLTWTNYRSSIGLTVDWADRSHSGFASPVCVG